MQGLSCLLTMLYKNDEEIPYSPRDIWRSCIDGIEPVMGT